MTRRALLVVLLAGCPKGSDHKKPLPTPGDAAGTHTISDGTTAIVLPPAPPVPALPAGLPPLPDSPALAVVTPDAVAFGELLFFEPRLATDGKTTCASCHDPAHGYAGGNDTTAAGQPNLRRTPTIVNLAWQKDLGWDGRYPSLDELLPAHLRGQLGADPTFAAIVDQPIYRAHLARVGGAPKAAVLHALEAYILTRYSGDSPWDRLEPTARVPKPGAPIDPIVAGYVVFAGKGQCAICHAPPLYTDAAYHTVTGRISDEGRAKVDPAKRGAFRTPTLRGVASRVAFLHDGSATSLDQAIDMHLPGAMFAPGFGSGGVFDPSVLDPALAKIKLSPDDRTNLVAFLRALTPTAPPSAKPVLP